MKLNRLILVASLLVPCLSWANPAYTPTKRYNPRTTLGQFQKKIVEPMARTLQLVKAGKLTHKPNLDMRPTFEYKTISMNLNQALRSMEQHRDKMLNQTIKNAQPYRDQRQDLYEKIHDQYLDNIDKHEERTFGRFGMTWDEAVDHQRKGHTHLYHTFKVAKQPPAIIKDPAVEAAEVVLKRARHNPSYRGKLAYLMKNPAAMAKFLDKWSKHELNQAGTVARVNKEDVLGFVPGRYFPPNLKKYLPLRQEIRLYDDLRRLAATTTGERSLLSPSSHSPKSGDGAELISKAARKAREEQSSKRPRN